MRKFILSALTAACAAVLSVLPVCAEPVDMGDGVLFDAAYYAQNNADVVRVYGTDPQMLYLHYNTFGKSEGRAPYAQAVTVNGSANTNASGKARTTPDTQAQFDAVFYANSYPDVTAVYGMDPAALYNHYLNLGYYEGRLGHKDAMAYVPESEYGKQVLKIVNQYRRENEMYDMEYSFELENSALMRCKELAVQFEHYRPDGSHYSTALPGWAESKMHGEVIAKDFATPEDVAFWWYDFRHDAAEMRKLILDFRFKEAGCAYWVNPKTGTTYWCLLMARRDWYTDRPGG